jgi:ubiquinone/menaquinone biosynthesis C-methylase UbiE
MAMGTFWDGVNPQYFLQSELEGYNKLVRQQYRTILQQLKVPAMLEVGCGPGVDYVGAIKTIPGINYTGVDLTTTMVEYCRKTFPSASFIQADIKQLPFTENQFDLVYCKDVLNHLDQWQDAFRELMRVSKKYVLVNFFYGLGTVTANRRIDQGEYINNYYDWNEVMTKLVAFRPELLTVYPIFCPPNGEEVLILFQKK